MPQTQEASATLLLSAPDVLAVVSLAGFGVLCGLIRSGRVGAADEAILRRLTWQRSPALAGGVGPGLPAAERVPPAAPAGGPLVAGLAPRGGLRGARLGDGAALDH